MGMIFLYIVPLIVIILTYGGIICHLHRKDVRWTRDDEGKKALTLMPIPILMSFLYGLSFILSKVKNVSDLTVSYLLYEKNF